MIEVMFLFKRGRLDTSTGEKFLRTRIKDTNEDDWRKLKKILSYLKNTLMEILTLEKDNNQKIK